MEKENLDEILKSTNAILKSSQELLGEVKAMNEGIAFLQNEYKTNKKYFRLEPGRTTIEDVIKTAFEQGWQSHKMYEYKKEKDESTENS